MILEISIEVKFVKNKVLKVLVRLSFFILECFYLVFEIKEIKYGCII